MKFKFLFIFILLLLPIVSAIAILPNEYCFDTYGGGYFCFKNHTITHSLGVLGDINLTGEVYHGSLIPMREGIVIGNDSYYKNNLSLTHHNLSIDEPMFDIYTNVTVHGLLNVTGNTYLGNIIITAENITVDQVLPLYENVTVSGIQMESNYSSSAGGVYQRYEYHREDDNNFPVRLGYTDLMQFTIGNVGPNENFEIQNVSIKGGWIGTASANDIGIFIFELNGTGQPTGFPIAYNGKYSISNFDAAGSWKNITLDVTTTLSAGVMYGIFINTTAPDGPNKFKWFNKDPPASYGGGIVHIAACNDGINCGWTALSTQDLTFEIWGKSGGGFTKANFTLSHRGLTLRVDNSSVIDQDLQQSANPIWSNVNSTNTFFSGLGSTSAPSFTFDGDVNTGVWRYSSDVLGLSGGGETSIKVGKDSVQISGAGIEIPSDLFGIKFGEVNDSMIYFNGSDTLFQNLVGSGNYIFDEDIRVYDSQAILSLIGNGDYNTAAIFLVDTPTGVEWGISNRHDIDNDLVFYHYTDSTWSSPMIIHNDTDNVTFNADVSINGTLTVDGQMFGGSNLTVGNIKLVGESNGTILSKQTFYNDTIGIIVYNDTEGMRMILGGIAEYV